MIYNHISLFFLFLFISLINTIATTHLYPIMLLGVIYYIFSYLLNSKEYYKILWIIFTFIIFEINFGFPFFSIILLSYFNYSIVIPYLSTNLSFNKDNYFLSTLIYYIIFYVFLILFYSTTENLMIQVFVNYIIDILILTVIL
jgi:hypothetical protein